MFSLGINIPENEVGEASTSACQWDPGGDADGSAAESSSGERNGRKTHSRVGTEMAGEVLLASLLFLSATVPCFAAYGSGECFFNTKGSCDHLGQVYGIGETWMTSDCFQCVCMEPFGVGCCDHGSHPVDYPDWCEIIRKPDSCTSVAVMKVNHKLPCLWGRGRLRPAAGQPWKSDNDPMF